KKARKKMVPNQQTAANNPAKAATAAHGWNHRSGTACGLPFDKCSTRACQFRPRKASISEKWDVCCCPKAARRSPTGAQKSHRRAYLIGQGGLAEVAERPLNMTSAVHRGRNEQSCSEFLDRADGPRRTEGTVMKISDIRTRIESGGDEQ